MNKIVVNIEYPGAFISVNHYKYKHFTKPEAKQWAETLGWLIKAALAQYTMPPIEDWNQPITVRVDGVFKDKRSAPDLHNLLKIICDVVEEVSGINDRTFLTETGGVTYGEPRLTITIKEVS